jgi:hypothetical protein
MGFRLHRLQRGSALFVALANVGLMLGALGASSCSLRNLGYLDSETDALPYDAGHDAEGSDAETDANGISPIAFKQLQATNAGATSSATLTFKNEVGAHHAIIVAFDYSYADETGKIPPPQIGDSLHNKPYEMILGPIEGNTMANYIFVVFDTHPGMDTVMVTLDKPAIQDFYVYIVEYSGLVATDVSAALNGRSTPGGMAKMASGTMTTRADHELIFGFGSTGIYDSGGLGARNVVHGEGFHQRKNSNGNVIEDMTVSRMGSYETTATMTVGYDWTMSMATFKGQ